jgi:hypothetical protein
MNPVTPVMKTERMAGDSDRTGSATGGWPLSIMWMKRALATDVNSIANSIIRRRMMGATFQTRVQAAKRGNHPSASPYRR